MILLNFCKSLTLSSKTATSWSQLRVAKVPNSKSQNKTVFNHIPGSLVKQTLAEKEKLKVMMNRKHPERIKRKAITLASKKGKCLIKTPRKVGNWRTCLSIYIRSLLNLSFLKHHHHRHQIPHLFLHNWLQTNAQKLNQERSTRIPNVLQ